MRPDRPQRGVPNIDRGNGEEARDTRDLEAEPGEEVADGIKCRGKMKTKGNTRFGDEGITRDLYKSSCSEMV